MTFVLRCTYIHDYPYMWARCMYIFISHTHIYQNKKWIRRHGWYLLYIPYSHPRHLERLSPLQVPISAYLFGDIWVQGGWVTWLHHLVRKWWIFDLNSGCIIIGSLLLTLISNNLLALMGVSTLIRDLLGRYLDNLNWKQFRMHRK